MPERTRNFSSKKFFSYCVVPKSAAESIATFFRNRHYLVRTTKDGEKSREIWTCPKVKNEG